MPVYLAKRLGLALLVAFCVSILAFLLLRLQGNAASALAGEGASAEDLAIIIETYGLDRPLVVQYASWLGNVLQGDFGTSYFFKTPVAELIFDKIGNTVILALLSLAIALAISIPLGVLAAVYSGSWIDRVCSLVSLMGQALPSFFLALCLVMLFAIKLRWLPAFGRAGTVERI